MFPMVWWVGLVGCDTVHTQADRERTLPAGIRTTDVEEPVFPSYDPRARRVLLFLNATTVEVLEGEVGLDGALARSLVDTRAGADTLLATEDDLPYPDLEAVLQVPGATNDTILELYTFVEANGLFADLSVWTELPPPLVPRSNHAMVTLPDGRLVVSGSDWDYRPSKKVEAFDPTTGAWTPLANMSQRRSGHQAVVLADGRMLVTGGCGTCGRGGREFAELYDPTTDTWSRVRAPSVTYEEHTLSALPDGRAVLVARSVVEVYDPARNRWRAVYTYFDPNWSRGLYGEDGHTATVLDDGRLVVISSDTALVIDPADLSYSIAGRLQVGRSHHSAVAVGPDEILVAGGTSLAGEGIPDAEILDLATGTSRSVGGMSVGRQDAPLVRLDDDRLLIVGGFEPTSPGLRSTETSEVFDLRTEQWSRMPDDRPRHGHTVAVLDGTVFVVGGDDDTWSPEDAPVPSVATVVLDADLAPPSENPTALQWEPRIEVDALVSPLGLWDSALAAHAPLVFDTSRGQVVAVRGSTGSGDFDFGQTLAWDGLRWTLLVDGAAMPGPPRTDHAVAYDESRGRMVLFGGMKRANFLLSDVWELDGATWTEVAPADGVEPPVRYGHQLTYDPLNERILLTGGQGEAYARLSDVWSWDGVRWTELSAGLPDFVIGSAAWDASLERMVALVDHQGTTQVWSFDGTSWQAPESATLWLPAGGTSKLVASPLHGSAVVVSRVAVFPNGAPPDTVVWERLGSWQAVEILATPAERYDYRFELVGDPVRGEIFANFDADNNGHYQTLGIVDRPNHAPSITTPPAGEVDFGLPYAVDLEATDLDGDVLVYGGDLPPGATIDPATGMFRWVPGESDGGTYTLAVWATDGRRTATTTLALEVTGPVTYETLPEEQDLEMTGTFAIPGYSSDSYCVDLNCSRIEYYWDWDAHFTGSCTFTGDNPGQVDVACTVGGQTEEYGGGTEFFNGYTTGDVQRDGTFVAYTTYGDVLTGRVEALPWEDYQVVIEGFEIHPNHLQGDVAVGVGPVSGLLDR